MRMRSTTSFLSSILITANVGRYSAVAPYSSSAPSPDETSTPKINNIIILGNHHFNESNYARNPLERNKPRGEETIEAETVVTLERREPSGLKLVSGSIMMDKAWVHWKRNTVEYRRAVETLVELMKKEQEKLTPDVLAKLGSGTGNHWIQCNLSSKQAKKRKLKEKRAIVAALRNSSNGGIRISDRNDGSPLTSQANDFHLSKKKSCVSEKSNSKKKNKSVKGATKRSKMSKMASRDTNDVDPTDGDFSAEEDAHDFSENDEIIPNSYSHGSRKNPTSNESHKSTKGGGFYKV
ncbi:hypothetical protein IFM89_018597 [Coptis chinensis]|uniref:Uncharacterized protein n=1 Tax=Coptis chinensis TaxID=261450 RepID=A0A835HZG6_9MAGN|nr:hypothetical protein IFM89_018597 [Coptis chinensis]